ncbi:hypothetical protein [Dictyobacter kobayashii]|uniref:hypothetical protein n=1 Tax=Dictyobacter kobayashii TaxID=2014872 RepID=UPI0013872AAB|nr:hypothetical protein [Dictyobacter kobayashii]
MHQFILDVIGQGSRGTLIGATGLVAPGIITSQIRSTAIILGGTGRPSRIDAVN